MQNKVLKFNKYLRIEFWKLFPIFIQNPFKRYYK